MRVNLSVPYREKDEAKRLGARWDHQAGLWFVENPEDLAPFARWLNLEAPPRRKAKKRPPARLEIRKGEKITGKDYRPSCGDCTTPPWEVCACSFEPQPDAAEKANAEAAARFQHMLDLEIA